MPNSVREVTHPESVIVITILFSSPKSWSTHPPISSGLSSRDRPRTRTRFLSDGRFLKQQENVTERHKIHVPPINTSTETSSRSLMCSFSKAKQNRKRHSVGTECSPPLLSTERLLGTDNARRKTRVATRTKDSQCLMENYRQVERDVDGAQDISMSCCMCDPLETTQSLWR